MIKNGFKISKIYKKDNDRCIYKCSQWSGQVENGQQQKCEVYSKLTIKAPHQKDDNDVVLVSLLLTLNISHSYLTLYIEYTVFT